MNTNATSTSFTPKESIFRRSLHKNFIDERQPTSKNYVSPSRRLHSSETKSHELLSTSVSFNPRVTLVKPRVPITKFSSQNAASQSQESLFSQTLYSTNKSNMSSNSLFQFKAHEVPSNREKVKDLASAVASTGQLQAEPKQQNEGKSSTNRIFKAAFASILTRPSNKNAIDAHKDRSKSESKDNSSELNIKKSPVPLPAEFSQRRVLNRSIDHEPAAKPKENMNTQHDENLDRDSLTTSARRTRNYKKLMNFPKDLKQMSLMLKENRESVKKYEEMVEECIISMHQKRFSQFIQQRVMQDLKIKKTPNSHKKIILPEPAQTSGKPREILLHHIIDTTGDHPEVTLVSQNSTDRMTKIEQQSGQIIKESLLDRISFKYTFFWYQRDALKDGWHPSAREGSTLVNYQDKLYLYGGESNSLEGGMLVLTVKAERWKSIERDGDAPQFVRRGHSCVEKGGELFIFGGEIGAGVVSGKRRCLNDLRSFDTRSNKWKILRLTSKLTARRNHAASIMDDLLVIYGGVNDDGIYLSDVITINLRKMIVQQYDAVIDSANNLKDSEGVAFHTMCPIFNNSQIRDGTSKFEIVKPIPHEGIYVFGGKNSSGEILNSLRVMSIGSEGKLIWKGVPVKGTPPSPRFLHSMNYYQKLRILVVFGGRNDESGKKSDQGGCLNDIHVLNIDIMSWCSLSVAGSELRRPRYSHNACVFADKLFILGGITNEGLQDCQFDMVELKQFEALRLSKLSLTGESDEGIIQKALHKAEEKVGWRSFNNKPADKVRSHSNDNQVLDQRTEDEASNEENFPRSYLPPPGHRRLLSLTQRKLDPLDQLQIKGPYARSVASSFIKATYKLKTVAGQEKFSPKNLI